MTTQDFYDFNALSSKKKSQAKSIFIKKLVSNEM